jgi:hypothetical protein
VNQFMHSAVATAFCHGQIDELQKRRSEVSFELRALLFHTFYSKMAHTVLLYVYVVPVAVHTVDVAA